MNHRPLLVLPLVLVATLPTLSAQEGGQQAPPTTPQAMPNPRTPEHDALKALTGTWDCAVRCTMPGQSEPTEAKGTEVADLVGNGLFLRTAFRATMDGKPFEGLWLMGYDPFRRTYTAVWVDSSGAGSATMDGAYDAAKKTWTWKGTTPHGDLQSTVVFQDADTSVETCSCKDADGKTIATEITRKRNKSVPAATEAALPPAKPATKDLAAELQPLQALTGEWGVTLRATPPGQPATEEKGNETVRWICDGKWLWSDFEGVLMGQPFKGHSLAGWDAAKKKYVSFWCDSRTGTITAVEGAWDAGTKTFTYDGKAVDANGKTVPFQQTLVLKDDAKRVLTLTHKDEKGADRTLVMEYLRWAKNR